MIKIYPIKTGLIKPGDDPVKKIVDSIDINISNKDVLVVSSKPILIAYGKVVSLNDISPSNKARCLAREYSVDPRFAELILKYARGVYGGVSDAILTDVDGVLIANAGLDRKNAGLGYIALPYTEIKGIAKVFHEYIRRKHNVKVGVIITDSMVSPLRRGTRAVAVEIYGFKPVKDYRGMQDLYNRIIRFTQFNIADSLASAAHLVIGEGSELVPAALIKGVDIELVDEDTTEDAKVDKVSCIYRNLYRDRL